MSLAEQWQRRGVSRATEPRLHGGALDISLRLLLLDQFPGVVVGGVVESKVLDWT